jgi:hypothetical protein
MTKYHCYPCNYVTDRKYNYASHNITQKHLDVIDLYQKNNNNSENNIMYTNGHPQQVVREVVQVVRPVVREVVQVVRPVVQPVIQKTIHNVINDVHHEDNEDGKHICPYCGAIFTDKSNKHRHLNFRCPKRPVNKDNTDIVILQQKDETIKLKEQNELLIKKIADLEKEQLLSKIRILEENLEKAEKQIDRKDSQIDRKDSQLDKNLDNVKGVTMLSMSALNYVNKYCSNAPALSTIPTLALTSISGNYRESILDILCQQKQNCLVKYLGGKLFNHYTRKDITQQSLHTTDVSRCTYVQQSIINEKPAWSVDKNGLEVCGQIVSPFLDVLKKDMQNYVDEESSRTQTLPHGESMSLHLDNLKAAADIVTDIKNKKLEEALMKELAPRLYLKRNCQKLITNGIVVKIEEADDIDETNAIDETEIKPIKIIKPTKPIKLKPIKPAKTATIVKKTKAEVKSIPKITKKKASKKSNIKIKCLIDDDNMNSIKDYQFEHKNTTIQQQIVFNNIFDIPVVKKIPKPIKKHRPKYGDPDYDSELDSDDGQEVIVEP